MWLSLAALLIDSRHAAKVEGLELSRSLAFPRSERQLLQEFLRALIADRYGSRQVFDCRTLQGDAVVLVELLLWILASIHLPGRVEATIDYCVCRCIGIVIPGAHHRWDPRLASFRNRGTNDRSCIVVARAYMLSETRLFIQGILCEEIILRIICTCWSLLLLGVSCGFFLVSEVDTLHRRSLQVLVLGVEVTVGTYGELFLCPGRSLILLPALLALFHCPSSWWDVDALVQSCKLLQLLRILLYCCCQSIVSGTQIDTVIHASGSCLPPGCSPLSEFLNKAGTIFLIKRSTLLWPPLEILKTGEVFLKVCIHGAEVN